MITFGICDDDRKFAMEFQDILLEELKRQKGTISEARCIYYENMQSVVENFEKDSVDIYFIDIEYGDTLGMDVARTLEKLRADIGLVYVTNHEHYAQEAFVCRPLGFIRKVHVTKDVKMALASVCEYLNRYRKQLVFKDNRTDVDVSLSYVRYIQMQDHIMSIVAEKGTIEVRDKMSRVEKALSEAGFIKINRSCMVNVKYIKEIKGVEIQLHTKEKLYASEDKKREIFLKWQLYCMNL